MTATLVGILSTHSIRGASTYGTPTRTHFGSIIRKVSQKIPPHARVGSFEYPGTMVERVQLLSREVAEKNEVLASILVSLSKEGTALEEVNWSTDPAKKRIEELKKFMKKNLGKVRRRVMMVFM